MSKIILILLASLVGFNVRAGFTLGTSSASTTYSPSTLYYATNAALFTSYGFSATNFTWIPTNAVDALSDPWEQQNWPAVQTSFDITGTNFEFVFNSFWYTPTNTGYSSGYSLVPSYFNIQIDGVTLDFTNQVAWPANGVDWHLPVTMTGNTTHHVWLEACAHFIGVSVPSNSTISSHPLPKQNLLLVEGDSYVQGYDPNLYLNGHGDGTKWLTGWVWQLAHLVPNTVPLPQALSGTGFKATHTSGTNVAPTYLDRVYYDICAAYTNAVNSGKYDKIFVTASGSLNDTVNITAGNFTTNDLFTAVTNVYTILKNNCPTAKIFVLGNPQYGFYANTTTIADYQVDSVMSNAAVALNLPYISFVQRQLMSNDVSYYVFFPTNGPTDYVHPSRAGYAEMAAFVNTSLATNFGSTWSAGGSANQSLIVNGTNGQNLLTNPSFELPSLSVGATTAFFILTNGWNWDQFQGGYIVTSNSYNMSLPPPDGSQAALLGKVSQTFSVTVANNYYVDFWLAKPPTGNGSGVVTMDGSVIYSWTSNLLNSDNTFRHIGTAPIFLGAGSHTILFASTNSLTLLDNVTVSTNAPVFASYALTVNGASGSGNYQQSTVIPVIAGNLPGQTFLCWRGDTTILSNLISQTNFATIDRTNVAITACYIPSTQSLTNFSVTNCGVVGDLIKLTVQTTSNSATVSVIGTNVFSSADIGKVIQVFRAGPVEYWGYTPANGVFTTNQDTVGYITDVEQGTNLAVSFTALPYAPKTFGQTMAAYCLIGSNNRNNLQTAISAAEQRIDASHQNITINIPDGTYLIAGSNAMNPDYVLSSQFDGDTGLVISSGGLTMAGASTNTVLMGVGAGMEHYLPSGSPFGNYAFQPLRGTLLRFCGPVTNSQYPLIIENITFDGGVTNGAQTYNYFPPQPGDGSGWDTSHHAMMDFGAGQQMHQMKIITNCVFQHWRGEMMINVTGDTGGTNTFIEIANSQFYDGNASANNLYFGQHVHGCTFNQLVKVAEYYQDNTKLPTLYNDNSWTNIISNALSIVGATTNATPLQFTISNNICAVNMQGVSCFHFAPAQNVLIISNSIIGTGDNQSGVSLSSIGIQPSDGSAVPVMSNIVVTGNWFTNVTSVAMDGYPCANISISNNLAGGNSSSTFLYIGAGLKTNIALFGNVSPGFIQAAGVQAGSYPLILTNNTFGPYEWDQGQYSPTNGISYGNGSLHWITDSSKLFYLDDSVPRLVPAGAVLRILNATQSNATIHPTANLAVAPYILSSGQSMNFYWSSGFWRTNPPSSTSGSTLSPPADLRIIH